jgi:hypothetical protein
VASRNTRNPKLEQHGVRHVRPVASNPKRPDDTEQDVLRDNLDVKTGQLNGPLSLLL